MYIMCSNQIFYEPEKFECAYPKIKETIPQSRVGYHSNNKYDGFPPLMSDGRSITASWQPEAVLNNYLLKEIDVQTNWQYRQYMIKNAKDIMKYNCVQASNDAGYIKRYEDLHNNSSTYSTPYIVPSFTDNSKPYGYQSSDLKDTYLTREQLNSRMVAPEITQEAMLLMRQQK
jgi:hypothetical protein